jgi:hypothetical protein
MFSLYLNIYHLDEDRPCLITVYGTYLAGGKGEAGRFIVDPSQQITSLHSTAPNLPEFVELDFQPSYWSIRQFGSVELKRN